MKKWQKIPVITLSIILLLGIIKNQIIKTVVATAASSILGAKVHIDSLAVGVFKPAIKINGLKVYNPKDFPKGILIDINKMEVQYNLPSILKGKLHLPLVALDLKEMIVVKNATGELNVDSLKVIQQEDGQKQINNKNKKPAKQMSMQIDELHLNLGKAIIKDYTKGELPTVLAYDIGIKNKIYTNIQSAQELVARIMLDAMGPIGLKSAAIYGAATALGVAFLPAGIAGILIGEDSVVGIYKSSPDKVFDKALELLQKIGTIKKSNTQRKTITANVYGADVNLTISINTDKKTEVRIKARQLMAPKDEIAGGVLYQLSQEIK
ncbi:MAG: hypothetical protein PHY73_03220 [Candidatus Omnitrophica bacterium]|nr:hypothetical protein [Candidatus Omnitrophota bacterium]